MITLWKRHERSHHLTRWGYVPASLFDRVPNLELNQSWNIIIPPTDLGLSRGSIPDSEVSEAVCHYFTVIFVTVNQRPHWVIIDGFEVLAAFKYCATFPASRE